MTSDEIRLITEKAVQWIGSQRIAFRSSAIALPIQTRSMLAPYFSVETLREARFAATPRIANPDFLSLLTQPGEPPPIDFSKMHGITFVDTVVFATWPGEPSLGLIAHELVHVVQYKLLGLPEFGHRYVQGWAENGRHYEAIPLEIEAYKLQAQFENPDRTPFSVEAAVRSQLQA